MVKGSPSGSVSFASTGIGVAPESSFTVAASSFAVGARLGLASMSIRMKRKPFSMVAKACRISRFTGLAGGASTAIGSWPCQSARLPSGAWFAAATATPRPAESSSSPTSSAVRERRRRTVTQPAPKSRTASVSSPHSPRVGISATGTPRMMGSSGAGPPSVERRASPLLRGMPSRFEVKPSWIALPRFPMLRGTYASTASSPLSRPAGHGGVKRVNGFGPA